MCVAVLCCVNCVRISYLLYVCKQLMRPYPAARYPLTATRLRRSVQELPHDRSGQSSSFLTMLKAAYTGAHAPNVPKLVLICVSCMYVHVRCASSSGPAHGRRRNRSGLGPLQPGLLGRHSLLRLRPPRPILVRHSAPSCFSVLVIKVKVSLCPFVCPRLFLRALRAALSGDDVRFSCECQYAGGDGRRASSSG